MNIAKYDWEKVGKDSCHVIQIDMEGQVTVLATLDMRSVETIVDTLNHLLRQTKTTWNTTWNRIMSLVKDPDFQYEDKDLDACNGIGLDDFNNGKRRGMTTREAASHVRWQSMQINGTLDEEALQTCIYYMRDKIYLID